MLKVTCQGLVLYSVCNRDSKIVKMTIWSIVNMVYMVHEESIEEMWRFERILSNVWRADVLLGGFRYLYLFSKKF